jgi:DNA-binding transcriptional LysR family regulator
MLAIPNNTTLRHLRAFVELARHGSYRACARRIHLSPSALSESIRQLEVALGLRLFDRSTRRVELTSAGHAFLEDATEVLALLESAVKRCRDVTDVRRGKLRIAAIPSLHAALVLPVLQDYCATYPEISVELIESRGHALSQLVRDGEVDVGLGGATQPSAGLALKALLNDRFGVMAPRNHPLLALKRLDWHTLDGQRFAALAGDTVAHALIATMEGAPAALLRPQFVAGSTPLLAELVERGMAIAVLSAISHRHPSLSPLGFRPLTGPVLERTLYLQTRSDASLSPAAVRFVALMQAQIKTHIAPGNGLKLHAKPEDGARHTTKNDMPFST